MLGGFIIKIFILLTFNYAYNYMVRYHSIYIGRVIPTQIHGASALPDKDRPCALATHKWNWYSE